MAQRWTKSATARATLVVGIAFWGTSGMAVSILDIQPQTASTSQAFANAKGSATLVQLNRNFEDWYLLGIRWPGAKDAEWFHLENPNPAQQTIRLSGEHAGEVSLASAGGGAPQRCALWQAKKTASVVANAARAKKPYVALCGGRLFLRNPTVGEQTTSEWAVEFLRGHGERGEKLIDLVKSTVFKDANRIQGDWRLAAKAAPEAQATAQPDTEAAVSAGPRAAELDRDFAGQRLRPVDLGISVALEQGRYMAAGHWYPALRDPHIHASAVSAGALPNDWQRRYSGRVAPLDRVERDALVYLAAFALDAYDVGYSRGTDNPDLRYSERTKACAKQPHWRGPNGFDSPWPLVSTGMINPDAALRVAAVFTGGFKRKHSVFRSGYMACHNGGYHYGFLEHGVLFSTLWPGLATLAIDHGGRLQMKTWSASDAARLGDLQFARQNGLPLLYTPEGQSEAVPGELVRRNFEGNWSGSKTNAVRTLRAGLCWQTVGGRQYLIYGYFSDHSPSAMATVFHAYGCSYAMHLDMNMIRHTYLAIHYPAAGDSRPDPEYLIKDMGSRDLFFHGDRLPRFVGAADNRDFFYLLRGATQPRTAGDW